MSAKTTYTHSVTLKRDRCKGCTNCIKHCPTEAIRVQKGKAKILQDRCIDCGECIRVCPYHAKIAMTDPLSVIDNYKYKIALPAPSLYGQFRNLAGVDRVIGALLAIGFDDVFEVARGADIVTEMTRAILRESNCKRPLISSACPAIVRLIRVRFPDLLQQIVPIVAPMDVAATLAKDEFAQKHSVPREEIGAFFLTPCAAKVTMLHQSLGGRKSEVDGAISILDIYGRINGLVDKILPLPAREYASFRGVGWARAGGESDALGNPNMLAVDGIENVIHALEEIENGKLNDLEYFEGNACAGGCVGGPLTFESGFVAQTRIRKLARDDAAKPPHLNNINMSRFYFSSPIEPNEIMQLDSDLSAALQKMEQMEQILAELPGLDCGSCGSPTCRSLAEDIVRGHALEMDCIFKLRERVGMLAEKIVELATQANPVAGETRKAKETEEKEQAKDGWLPI